MKRKISKIFIILFIINVIIISTLFLIFKDTEEENYNESFRQLKGVWGYKEFILEINEVENELIYQQGKYNTDEIKIGKIKNIEEITHSKYELKIIINDEETNNEKNKKIEYIVIEKNNKKNILIYENNEYRYITSNSENKEAMDSFY